MIESSRESPNWRCNRLFFRLCYRLGTSPGHGHSDQRAWLERSQVTPFGLRTAWKLVREQLTLCCPGPCNGWVISDSLLRGTTKMSEKKAMAIANGYVINFGRLESWQPTYLQVIPFFLVKGKMMLSELFAPEHSCCVIFKWFRYLYIR